MKTKLCSIFMVIGLLVSSAALASGKLSFESDYFVKPNQMGPKVGLGVYQKLFKNISYNMWSGAGWVPSIEGNYTVLWLSSKHDIEYYYGPFTIAAGFTWRSADSNRPEELGMLGNPDIHLKVVYQLW